MLPRHVGAALALALPLATAGPAAAQDVLVGAKGGLNIADVSVEDVDDAAESATGFIGGGFLRLGLGPVLALQPEVLFTQKGAEGPEGEAGASADVNLDYLEVPLLLMLRFPVERSPVRPHLFAGPAVAFELTCELDVEGGGTSVSSDCAEAVEVDELLTKSVDIAGVFGAGADLQLGDRAVLTLEGRYTLGLTNIQDVETEEELKNRVLSFLAGIGLRLP